MKDFDLDIGLGCSWYHWKGLLKDALKDFFRDSSCLDVQICMPLTNGKEYRESQIQTL